MDIALIILNTWSLGCALQDSRIEYWQKNYGY